MCVLQRLGIRNPNLPRVRRGSWRNQSWKIHGQRGAPVGSAPARAVHAFMAPRAGFVAGAICRIIGSSPQGPFVPGKLTDQRCAASLHTNHSGDFLLTLVAIVSAATPLARVRRDEHGPEGSGSATSLHLRAGSYTGHCAPSRSGSSSVQVEGGGPKKATAGFSGGPRARSSGSPER